MSQPLRDKKVNLSNDISDLAAKKDFIALKAEVDQLDSKKLKIKVDDLYVGKLKTIPVPLFLKRIEWCSR